MLLAWDDTDDPEGGCTSHTLLGVLARLPGLVPRGLPRLVRLNPNVPWKTRGNAAVCVALGVARGPHARAGEWRGQELRVHPEAAPAPPEPWTLEAAWQAVAEASRPGSDPAVVLAPEPLPEPLYWQAVRTVVEPEDALAVVEASGGLWRAGGDGRGIVGAAAAAAWPGPPSSYEFTAYREPGRWGTPRAVDPAPLRGADAAGATFHTWDPGEERPTCIPRTPCPVLLGLRGRDPDALRDAAFRLVPRVAREPVDAWVLWATNQASGDHVTRVERLAEAPPAGTVELAAQVVQEPTVLRGGHVVVGLEDAAAARFEAVAFEPTHGLRQPVRALAPGDAVTVVGAVGAQGLRLEKLRVDALAPRFRRVANPSCPACGRSMRSRGCDAGYRCASCRTRAPPGSAVREAVAPEVAPGWHEAAVMARRHLHRPAAWDP
jgi:tRNA(Ile2)-agmatinylcytidine synthase